MARLETLKAGDTIIEMLGAQTDRNYFSGGPVELHVQLFGSGSVQYQINNAFIFRGERAGSISGQVPINTEKVADPTNWTNVGAVITAASGLTVIPLSALVEPNFIRAIVTVAGDGYLSTATHWD